MTVGVLASGWIPLGEMRLPLGKEVPGTMCRLGDRDVLQSLRCIEGSRLVETVIDVIEQPIVHAESGIDDRPAFADGVP